MNNVVNWFEIYTSDFERAKTFYKTVFMCDLKDIDTDSDRHTEMRYATFSITGGEPCGALVYLDVAKPGMGGTLVYFQSDDIDAELSRVAAAGGKVIRAKQSVGAFGFIALAEDTEGNMIGLRSTK